MIVTRTCFVNNVNPEVPAAEYVIRLLTGEDTPRKAGVCLEVLLDGKRVSGGGPFAQLLFYQDIWVEGYEICKVFHSRKILPGEEEGIYWFSADPIEIEDLYLTSTFVEGREMFTVIHQKYADRFLEACSGCGVHPSFRHPVLMRVMDLPRCKKDEPRTQRPDPSKKKEDTECQEGNTGTTRTTEGTAG